MYASFLFSIRKKEVFGSATSYEYPWKYKIFSHYHVFAFYKVFIELKLNESFTSSIYFVFSDSYRKKCEIYFYKYFRQIIKKNFGIVFM